MIPCDILKEQRKDVNPENTKVYIEFIMDGAGAKPGESKTFPLTVVVDPVITDDTEDTHYVNHPPCAAGVIYIKVMIMLILGHAFYGKKHNQVCPSFLNVHMWW